MLAGDQNLTPTSSLLSPDLVTMSGLNASFERGDVCFIFDVGWSILGESIMERIKGKWLERFKGSNADVETELASRENM